MKSGIKSFHRLYMLSKRGDTLVKIAHKFGTTVDKIKKKNALRQDQIYPNQRLYIN